MIRLALEQRVAGHQPPEYGRQILLARAREAALAQRATPRGLFRQLRSLSSPAPVNSVLWVYSTRTGRLRHDAHLSLAINSFTSPLLNLMR